MGACQCIERQNKEEKENNEISTVVKSKKPDIVENSRNKPLSKTSGLGVLSEQISRKNSENSLRLVNASKNGDPTNSLEQPLSRKGSENNLQLVKASKNRGPTHLQEEANLSPALPGSGVTPGKENSESTTVIHRLNTDDEISYLDYSKEIFSLLNSVRSFPEAYQSHIDSNLKNIFKKLIDERSENILWSQKFYDLVLEYFKESNDKNITNDQICSYLNSRIKLDNVDNLLISIYSFTGKEKFNVNETFWGLISENQGESQNILLRKYNLGFVCCIPVNAKCDKTFLFLIIRN